MNYPKVSCLMPTCGRYPNSGYLIEEAVESFIKQDYKGKKELVILNDCPEQTFYCNYKQVRIHNVTERYSSLGEKYNHLVNLADSEILLPWEDDDISLPWRISQAVGKLCEGYDYFNPQQSWFYHIGILHKHHAHGVCHNASAFTKSAWQAIGGYPATSGNQDMIIDAKLKAQVRVAPPLTHYSQWSYIYCWGRGFHLSGNTDHEQAYKEYGQSYFRPGFYVITPQFYEDYNFLVTLQK